jgi:hypothetical protein
MKDAKGIRSSRSSSGFADKIFPSKMKRRRRELPLVVPAITVAVAVTFDCCSPPLLLSFSACFPSSSSPCHTSCLTTIMKREDSGDGRDRVGGDEE